MGDAASWCKMTLPASRFVLTFSVLWHSHQPTTVTCSEKPARTGIMITAKYSCCIFCVSHCNGVRTLSLARFPLNGALRRSSPSCAGFRYFFRSASSENNFYTAKEPCNALRRAISVSVFYFSARLKKIAAFRRVLEQYLLIFTVVSYHLRRRRKIFGILVVL